MASLSKDNRLQFKGDDGKRQTLRLGKIPRKQAQGIQRHVERLIACKIDGSAPPDETSRWVAGVSDVLRAKLAKVDLLHAKVNAGAYTVGQLVAEYKARPVWKGHKPNTRNCKVYGFKKLVEYFGGDMPIKQITPAKAMDFYCNLQNSEGDGGRGLAVATCNLTAKVVFTLLNYAIDSEALDRNPFKGVPRGTCKGNNVTVPDDESLQVLNAMRGTQEKLLFGLSRWGGLRVPSEPLRLRWCDIDWEGNRFLVHAPKTERHEGHETRWVPIFDELSPLFDARFTEAAEGDEYVLPMIQGKSEALATRVLQRALMLCGVEQWPRLWHSMRSTRQTELEVATGNRDIVCAWLGNSPKTAQKHYINFTDQHFSEAAAKVTQKATQHIAASSGNAGKGGRSAGTERLVC